MNILVTGSQGLVGKRLVYALRNRGYVVKEFDKKLGHDITNSAQCMNACKGIDVVIHCAASLEESDPKLFEINVNGTRNVLESAVKNQVERVICLSSVGVYGNAQGMITEDMQQKPVTQYEKSKYQAELVIEEYQEMISVTILRPAIVVGPNQQWKGIIQTIQKGFPLIGSGKNHWQIVHVDDVVNAIVFCLEHDETQGETYTIAEEKASTLNELVEIVYKVLGIKKEIKHIPTWLGKLIGLGGSILSKITGKPAVVTLSSVERLTRNREYSIQKIKALGWKPKHKMNESVTWVVRELNMRR